jgi:hypothetical protein
MACDRIVPAIVKSSIALSPAIISQQSLVISDINSGLEFRLRQNKEVHYCRLNALKDGGAKTSD